MCRNFRREGPPEAIRRTRRCKRPSRGEGMAAAVVDTMKTPEIDWLLRAASHHEGIISFAGGLPSPATFPCTELAKCAETAALQLSSLQYDWPEGRPALREQI